MFRGGTNAEKAPQIDYFQRVFGPIASRFGIKYALEVGKRGFFPKGRGEATLIVEPLSGLNPIEMTDPGEVKKISLYAFVAGSIAPRVRRVQLQSRSLHALTNNPMTSSDWN